MKLLLAGFEKCSYQHAVGVLNNTFRTPKETFQEPSTGSPVRGTLTHWSATNQVTVLERKIIQ